MDLGTNGNLWFCHYSYNLIEYVLGKGNRNLVSVAFVVNFAG